MTSTIAQDMPYELDTKRKFVRVTGHRGEDFIEFDFAIGEPDIFVEMILSPAAFEEFCRDNNVEPMPEVEQHDADSEDAQWDWRLADATQVRFKN
jgi:phenol hydroxylase P0 protein